MRILVKSISMYVVVHMYVWGIHLAYLCKVPVILQHMPRQVQVTYHKMKSSGLHCSDSVRDNSTSDWQRCNLTLWPYCVSHCYSHLHVVVTCDVSPAYWLNTRNFVNVLYCIHDCTWDILIIIFSPTQKAAVASRREVFTKQLLRFYIWYWQICFTDQRISLVIHLTVYVNVDTLASCLSIF